MTTPVSKSGIEAGDEGATARAGAGGTESALCAPGKTSRGRRCTQRQAVPRVGISRDELQSRIAAPAELTAIELIDTLEELHRMQAMLEERKLSLTTTLVDQIAAEYKQVGGWSSTALDVAESEVSVALVMNRYNAGKHIGIATALRDRLPRVRDALAKGSVDLARAHQINNATCNVSDALIDEVERQAMRKIIPDPASPRSGLTGKRLTNAIGRIVNKLDPDGVRERRAARRGERYVGVGKDEDGMSYLHGSLPAADAQKLDGRLREMAGGPCDRDGRNFDQRRADSLIALVDGRAFLPCDCDRADCPRRSAPLTTPRKPLVHVIMLKETLDGTSDEPAFLDGHGIIDAAYGCEIARDAHTVTVKLPEDVRRRLSVPAASSHGERADPSPPSESSAPLPDSAFTYRPGSVLATWVRILGGMCRWPHCDAAAWNADLDHTEPFNHRSPENGGATTANGLKPYCRHHHRLKHSGYWREVPANDGSVVVISGAGSSYTSTDSGLLDVLDVDPVRVADDAEAASAGAPPTTVANDADIGTGAEQHATPSEAEAESQTPNPAHDAAPAQGRKRRTREQNRMARVRAERRRQHAREVVQYRQSQSRRERRLRLFDGSTAVPEDHDDGAPAPF